ncbi:flagellar filament capping protein FliD [Eubacteriaceae bacterium ES2]|nr:flagellar filament capping protein FliD [Eubacteriaceae bacterium ES2]
MASSVSSTSSGTTLSSLSATTGIGGLVSGLDTDSLVESLTSATREKIAAQQQKLQLLEWKQTAYQSVTSALQEFQSKYLDVLSSTNFTSSTMFNAIAASTTSSAISVSSTSNVSVSGSITIDSITQLATSQKYVSANSVSASLGGTTAGTGNYADLSGKSFLLSRDGTTKTVTLGTLDASSTDADLQTALQDAIDTAFGSNLVDVSVSGGELSITSSGTQLTAYALNSDTDTLADLGMTHGQTDRMRTSTSLENLPLETSLASQDTYSLTINNVDFTFNKTDTLASVMSKINSSNADVTMAYSSITDKFTLTADNSGSGENIVVTDTDGLFASFGLSGAADTDTTNVGQNAILSVNGVSIERSSNDITIDGVKVSLLEVSADPIEISLSTDTTELKDTIKSFVEDYNTMIDLINSLTKEEKYSDYAPLTDDQKDEMSDDEIEKWETKAKSGVLRSDSILRGIASKMQTLMYSTAVEGGLSLYSLGIESAGYAENGKLTIDEDKLDDALANNIDGVRELFTTETTGIATGLDSIIESATKTSGARGSRGSLIEKAGYPDTMSSTQNIIYDNIEDINDYIAKLQDKLETQETYYWNKFSALETALQQLNTQSSMITSFASS